MAALPAAALALLLLAGCTGGSDQAGARPGGPRPTGQSQAVTQALDSAVASVDRTRRVLLAAPASVIEAATALDAADKAGLAGDDDTARRARLPVSAALSRARTALGQAPAEATAYRAALAALGRAAPPGQAAPLAQVIAAGQAEAAASESFARTAATVLERYRALDQAQATWVQRAGKGWYRTTAEAAGAYAVFVRPGRGALQQARDGLRDTDAALGSARARQQDALTAADAALQALRTR